MKSPGDFGEHPRVLALIERFRCIDAAMRALPLYNAKVAIEAIGFRPFGDDTLLGVVLTPWFMNVMTLPVEPAPIDMAEIGKTIFIELPAGKRAFVVGGDEVIGLYRAHSLHSPVLNFTLPGQARAEAQLKLAILMTPVTAETTATRSSSKTDIDRRALLFGRRPFSTPAPIG
jgi:[NiFe] hydrogenase assembly HybE family chaperone